MNKRRLRDRQKDDAKLGKIKLKFYCFWKRNQWMAPEEVLACPK